MVMTRNGVVYNLKKSPYIVDVLGVKYYFSSVNHKEKFNEKLLENREILNYSLKNRFKIHICFNELADIVLYRKVETRGFLVEVGGEFFTCVNQVKLGGARMIGRK